MSSNSWKPLIYATKMAKAIPRGDYLNGRVRGK